MIRKPNALENRRISKAEEKKTKIYDRAFKKVGLLSDELSLPIFNDENNAV